MKPTSVVKPQSISEKKTHTVVDTIMVTPEIVNQWRSPGFQRPVKENANVLALSEDLKRDSGVWPGIITLGILNGSHYIVDGQHRRAAFLMSKLEEGYTDVRMLYVSSMAEMGEEFVKLNSQLSRLVPDDILRGLEDSVPALRKIRDSCSCIGYDSIRRGQNCPLISMAAVLRQWHGSAYEVPSISGRGLSTSAMAENLSEEETDHFIDFMKCAQSAFGRDPEYYRLWGALNMIICMWLYRRLVLGTGVSKISASKIPRLSKETFRKCLMSVSADSHYLDWLVGRMMGERDRSPAYTKVKTAFVQRLFVETGKKAMLPQPSWHSGGLPR